MERMRRTGHELTSRQREVLQLVAKGHTNGEIAELLGISVDGVKWHVSELLMRLDLDSREELADFWASETGLRGRLGRFAAALGGLVPLKAAAGAIGGLALLSGAGLGAAVLVAHATDGSVANVTTSDTVSYPSVLPSQPADAKWTPQQAYDHAKAAAAKILDENRSFAPAFSDLTLTVAEWHPGIAKYDVPGVFAGDHFSWTSAGGVPLDVWRFHWELAATQPGTTAGAPHPFSVEVLVQDGSMADALATSLTSQESASGWVRGLFGGFRKQTHSDPPQVQPSGPSVRVASLNNQAGEESLFIYPNQAGTHCVQDNHGTLCGLPSVSATRPVEIQQFGMGASITDATPRDRIVAWLSEDTTRIEVLPGDGTTLSFDAVTPPPGLKLGMKLAYVAFAPGAGNATVIADAADGSELGRTTTAIPPLVPSPPQP